LRVLESAFLVEGQYFAQCPLRPTGLQKNAAGVPYGHLPLPWQLPGFANATIDNRPFRLSPYIPADDDVPWDPMPTSSACTDQP
jgi:hypothetical protein